MPPAIFATDAMGAGVDNGGYGIVGTAAKPAEIMRLYRHAKQLSYTVPRVDGDLSGLKRPERAAMRTILAIVLDDAWFVEERWRSIDKGRWGVADHITLGEGRTVIRLLRRLVSSVAWHGRLVVSLQDNRPICGAVSKGRSPAWHINRLCRQRASCTLAGAMRLLLPWIETVKQPADRDSRDVRPSLPRRGEGAQDQC